MRRNQGDRAPVRGCPNVKFFGRASRHSCATRKHLLLKTHRVLGSYPEPDVQCVRLPISWWTFTLHKLEHISGSYGFRAVDSGQQILGNKFRAVDSGQQILGSGLVANDELEHLHFLFNQQCNTLASLFETVTLKRLSSETNIAPTARAIGAMLGASYGENRCDVIGSLPGTSRASHGGQPSQLVAAPSRARSR